MITPSHAQKHYASAQDRLLAARIADFFEVNFPRFFGPEIRARIAEQLLELMATCTQPTERLQPGQCLWLAVARDTRADSPRRRLVPVVLTLVAQDDITRLTQDESPARVAQDATARLLQEAHAQGGLLSMRDIGLLTWRRDVTITQYRQAWEAAHQQVLPHPGSLQDMGSCVTHKVAIVRKVVYQHQDARQVARETHHSQQAVDRYLRDFHRVRTCAQQHADLDFISQVTGMTPHLVKQYLKIMSEYEPTPLTGKSA